MAVSVHELDEDAALVTAVQAGDVEAFAELFRRHYGAVRRACARRLHSMAEADEIAQAAFVRAFERIDRCVGDRRFGPWVQVIAQRLCVDAARAQARTTPHEEPVPGAGEAGPNAPEEQLLARLLRADVDSALATLPPRQREVVIARDLHDRRPTEIAAALGLSVGAVDSLLLRARRRLAFAYRSVAGDGGMAQVSSAATAAAAGGGMLVPGSVAVAIAGAAEAGRRVGNEIVAAASSVSGMGAARRAVAAVATTVMAAVSAPAPAPEAVRQPWAVHVPAVPRFVLPVLELPEALPVLAPAVPVPVEEVLPEVPAVRQVVLPAPAAAPAAVASVTDQVTGLVGQVTGEVADVANGAVTVVGRKLPV